MKITGVVLNKDSKPESFAKVFVSDYKGSITPKKIGAITDDNGKFNLDLTNKDGDYLTAKTSLGEQTTSKIKDNVSEYALYLDVDRSQNLQEVVVTANRPTSNTSTENNKPKPNVNVDTSKYKKRIFIGLGILATLIVVGGTIYILRKNK
jgi:hypothetical protein